MDYKTMGNTHNGILLSNKEEQNDIIHKKMGGPWEHYVKWDYPSTERKGTYVFSNMLELGNIWDTRGTSDNEEDHHWGQGERVG